MSDSETIKRFLLKRLKRQKFKKTIRSRTPLIKESILDSFGFLELVAFLEDRFDIQFKQRELNDRNFSTLAAIAKVVRSKRKGAARP